MTQERILKEATFAPDVVRYYGTSSTVGLICTIVGTVLIPIALPITIWYWTKQYARMRVYLTTRDLKVHRGVLNREEKSIPLEKITDLAVFQGPVMRYFGLKGIRVETAGQSAAAGALVSIVGIEDTDGFRDLVLSQRDRITDSDDRPGPEARAAGARLEGTRISGAPASAGTGDAALLAALRDIHETLKRIEDALRR